MANLIGKSKKDRTYDAIVVGSGMTGGWAAKELAEKGLKVLMLERGREVRHIEDYPTAHLYPYEVEHRNQLTAKLKSENPIVSRCHVFSEDKAHFFVKDHEHPYIQDAPFDWIRGYQTGGRSLLWGRMVQRWSDYDFEGPARDGFVVDWPIRYRDLAPWYSHVEKFIGVSGNKDGLECLPDGEFLPPMELTVAERYFKSKVAELYKDRHIIIARCAHITGNYDYYAAQSRGGCQHRDQCRRGCPLAGNFSSNSSTIPWALKTGNLEIVHFAVVESILYNETTQKADGLRVIHSETGEASEYYARVIFVNAGSINTNLLLLNSRSNRFPNGLGNDSGVLGKYVAFNNYRARVTGIYNGFQNYRTTGRRPTQGYVPRFRNLKAQDKGVNFLRGYAATFGSWRQIITNRDGFGPSLKENLFNPAYGPWTVASNMMGETIPKETNNVELDDTQKDRWGIPLLKISVTYDQNDEAMIKGYQDQFAEMFEKAGVENIKVHDSNMGPGLDIHEMGGVRMGKDPKTSLLNMWNQMHACKNVFVTDGACMTSTSTQNPSLTYMALTARAANYAADEMKKGNL